MASASTSSADRALQSKHTDSPALSNSPKHLAGSPPDDAPPSTRDQGPLPPSGIPISSPPARHKSSLAPAPAPGHTPSTRSRRSQRSVSFSPDSEPSRSNVPPGIMDQTQRTDREDTPESSADERTAMMQGGRKADYGTGASTSAGASTGVDTGQQQDEERPEDVARRQGNDGPGRNGKNKGSVKTRESWWQRIVEKYGSVELENKGSVARDHLALERTFLAWLRTSLSFASIGVAITQLFRLNTNLLPDPNDPAASQPTHAQTQLRRVGKPLGATFLAVAIIVLLLGFHRYFESQHYVIRGKFPASRGSILLVSLVAGALITTSLVVVVSVGASMFEN